MIRRVIFLIAFLWFPSLLIAGEQLTGEVCGEDLNGNGYLGDSGELINCIDGVCPHNSIPCDKDGSAYECPLGDFACDADQTCTETGVCSSSSYNYTKYYCSVTGQEYDTGAECASVCKTTSTSTYNALINGNGISNATFPKLEISGTQIRIFWFGSEPKDWTSLNGAGSTTVYTMTIEFSGTGSLRLRNDLEGRVGTWIPIMGSGTSTVNYSLYNVNYSIQTSNGRIRPYNQSGPYWSYGQWINLYYSCPYGGTLSGSQCISTTTTDVACTTQSHTGTNYTCSLDGQVYPTDSECQTVCSNTANCTPVYDCPLGDYPCDSSNYCQAPGECSSSVVPYQDYFCPENNQEYATSAECQSACVSTSYTCDTTGTAYSTNSQCLGSCGGPGCIKFEESTLAFIGWYYSSYWGTVYQTYSACMASKGTNETCIYDGSRSRANLIYKNYPTFPGMVPILVSARASSNTCSLVLFGHAPQCVAFTQPFVKFDARQQAQPCDQPGTCSTTSSPIACITQDKTRTDWECLIDNRSFPTEIDCWNNCIETQVCEQRPSYSCPQGDFACEDIYGTGSPVCSSNPCVNILITPPDETPSDTSTYQNDGVVDQATGACSGIFKIFNGKGYECLPPGLKTTFFDCCDTDEGSFLFINEFCPEDSIKAVEAESSGRGHYVGDYCKQKIPLIGCVQKARMYCTFNSKMARIVHEQGRAQLQKFAPDGNWGSPEAPNCEGFTPEEFQMLDFSQIDLSEMFGDLVPVPVTELQTDVQDAVNRFQENLQ